MRDIIITVVVFGTLPYIMRKPFFGVLVWTCLGLMNPHRLAWGFATTLPFALIVFFTTILSYAMSKEPKKIPMSREIVLLTIFTLWMFTTTAFSWYPALAWPQWDKVWRIQIGILLTLMLTINRERLHLLMWTICVSLGFWGFKGGIWFLLSGGANRVYGPDGSFISGNNELGLALVMTIPLIWYLILNTKVGWARTGLYGALFFSLVATIGTHSRGALVGLVFMGVMFIIKSRRKFIPILGAIGFAALLPYIAPAEWFSRMHSIETYQEDESAMERIRTWKVAAEIAKSDILGGGFEVLRPTNGTDAHSIYFEVLSEQGYIGIAMFLTLGLLTFMKAQRIKNLTRRIPDASWARDLATMIQTSLVGYATCGAFLGLGYFDLAYILIVIVVVLEKIVLDQHVRTVPARRVVSTFVDLPSVGVLDESFGTTSQSKQPKKFAHSKAGVSVGQFTKDKLL